MPDPIPSTLSPLLRPSTKGSLTLITSVLDATPNWLTLRYLYAALGPAERADDDRSSRRFNVILISFLRPFELWREMGRKIVL
jgi:elongator complex protein 6